jgi:hypothetical protein
MISKEIENYDKAWENLKQTLREILLKLKEENQEVVINDITNMTNCRLCKIGSIDDNGVIFVTIDNSDDEIESMNIYIDYKQFCITPMYKNENNYEINVITAVL